MPRELVTVDGRSFRYRDYELSPPGPDRESAVLQGIAQLIGQ